MKLCDSSVTSVPPAWAALVTFIGRLLLLAALVTAAIPASAQLIPWSEPPTVRGTGVPPVISPASSGPGVSPVKSPAATPAAALTLPPSSLDEPLIFQAFTAPSLVLTTFAPTDPGATRAGTSWVGQVTQNATTLTVAGTAADDNGWGASGLSLNAAGYTSLTLTAQRDAGNATPTLFLQFEDRSSRTKIISVSTSLFALGTPTTVQVPLSGWTIDFGPSDLAAWSIGGGSVGTVAFRMTFDEISFGTSAIPEPSTYAALLGLFALGLVGYRRRAAGR